MKYVVIVILIILAIILICMCSYELSLDDKNKDGNIYQKKEVKKEIPVVKEEIPIIKEEVKKEIPIVKKEKSSKEEPNWVKEWEKRVKLNNRDYGGLFKPRSEFNKDKTYDELLEDSRWKEKRDKILKRDGYQCCWCHRTDHLQVHHKVYNTIDGKLVEPWDYPDKVLMTLCDDCHKKYHQKYRVHTYPRKRWEHYK